MDLEKRERHKTGSEKERARQLESKICRELKREI